MLFFNQKECFSRSFTEANFCLYNQYFGRGFNAKVGQYLICLWTDGIPFVDLFPIHLDSVDSQGLKCFFDFSEGFVRVPLHKFFQEKGKYTDEHMPFGAPVCLVVDWSEL